MAAARAEPHADTAPARCPYRFDSTMPAATFCVYRGVAFGRRGEVCAPDAVVIWSSFDANAPDRVGAVEPESGSTRVIYLAFVADPEFVLRASVGQSDRADVVGYTAGRDQASQPLAGQMTLRTLSSGSTASVDVLNIVLREDWREPRRLHSGNCVFASYSGTFLGVIRPPGESEAAIHAGIAPQR